VGELLTEVQALRKENAEIKTMLHQLTVLVMKDKIDTTWVAETEAAAMVGLHPRVFREKVKAAKAPWFHITLRHTNGRNYQYSRKGIIKFKQLTSTEMI